ncbi:YkgJ family cysteine cluster protein [Aquabacterium sp. OR-4]|uniref:YkgJ family cysteine cluster protein n=1 Tax=Aquabacterium sp. OR-4 TaxID=2978127 RepID=UPI0021B1AD5D|nr:YkgJ family cysteine cluster protein [Aquabacterium sp. OR-4]MDT7833793.1 YkgJ family cysteine cluster protein [Aquabacterium sp. OR-4]
MDCRPACAACCIAPSISTPIPGMPQGKPAGVPCVQLDEALRCRLFGHADRPAVCGSLRPVAEMCGDGRTHALHWLSQLEAATAPPPPECGAATAYHGAARATVPARLGQAG